jgi:hypothetical protein
MEIKKVTWVKKICKNNLELNKNLWHQKRAVGLSRKDIWILLNIGQIQAGTIG